MKPNAISKLLFMTLVGLVTSGCEKTPSVNFVQFEGRIYGTTYKVKLSRGRKIGSEREVLHRKVDQKLKELDLVLSTYKPKSELSRWNRSKSLNWVEISNDLYTNLNIARQISQKTKGAYDVTVGPLVNLWGFGPEAQPVKIPTEAEIKRLRTQVGYQKLSFKTQNGKIFVKKSSVPLYVDLSSVAKGYVVDQISKLMIDEGAGDHMVEIGGEVRVHGKPPAGQSGWRLGLEKPVPGKRQLQRVLEVNDLSLATSGTYRNYFERNGVRFSHTIDPRSGKPISHRLLSVSVLHSDCAVADAWATALMVTGAAEGLKMAQKHEIAALFLSMPTGAAPLSSETQIVEHMSANFEKIVVSR